MRRRRLEARALTIQPMRHFATAIAGIGPLLAEELAGTGATRVSVSSDGRNDVVLFEARGLSPSSLRCAEDVYASVGRCRAGASLATTVRDLLATGSLEQALSAWAAQRGPLRRAMPARVITRVEHEQLFTRRQARDALQRELLRLRPRWRAADPAEIELWALQLDGREMVSGIRLTTADLRQRGGREQERPGALRPTVAAAMVRCAGQPRGDLLDPCCGSGTILAEAIAAGWRARGFDVDQHAVGAARSNVPASEIHRGDVHHLPLAAGSVGAVVSNLPFGARFEVHGGTGWYAATLHELQRVAAPAAALVLLGTDELGLAIDAVGLPVERSLSVQLLGRDAGLWVLRCPG